MMKYRIMLLLLAGVFAFASCSKEEEVEDPFTGKDSYITAFSLKQGELVFNAAIIDREIVVTVPEGFSLRQATATVKLSENAKIYPDPAEVTDWDEERQFAVTAYNSGQIRYKYTVKHRGLAHEGTVVLETQAEVEAFGQQGITLIDGNLTIGRATGIDSITSLAPLAGLKEVAYNITLNPTCAITGLEGLESLESVGGIFQIGALKHLEILGLPALKTVGSFNLNNTVTFIAEFPELASASKVFSLNCPLYQLQLPKLQSAGSLTLTTSSNSSSSLAKISLPALEEVNGVLLITYFNSLAKIELPVLKKAGGLTTNFMNLLSFVYAPRVEEITGDVNAVNVPALAEYSLPSLQKAGSFTLNGAALGLLEFPKLSEIAGIFSLNCALLREFRLPELQKAGSLTIGGTALSVAEFPKLSEIETAIAINNTALTVFRLPELQKIRTLTFSSVALDAVEFPKLGEAGGVTLSAGMSPSLLAGFPVLQNIATLTLTNLKDAVRLELPASMQRIDRLVISASAALPVGEINVKGKNIGILELQSYATNAKLTGDEVFHGALVTSNSSVPLPRQMEGFREVDSLYIRSGMIDTVTVSGIRKINRGAYFSGIYGGYPKYFRIPDLEEVGGTLTLAYTSMTNTTTTALEMEKLKRVGGDFIVNVLTNLVKTFNFPELTDVGGNLNLTSGYDYSNYLGFETLNFPKLTTVGGKLSIHSGSTSQNNRQLKNLDGFAALSNVGSIEVSRQASLESYEGLKEVFKTLPEENWIRPTNNGYNPSWQDLKDGKWEQL
ncbi:MAG: hypothetical protein LBK58_03800 [Prevotellaceae bacterium]|jgi:hypothetical protein|nr:hypothetical protein [Prevotellaceae bacterium]